MANTFSQKLKDDNEAKAIIVTYKMLSMFIISNVILLYYFLTNILVEKKFIN